MNRISFLKQLLVTLFGAAIASPTKGGKAPAATTTEPAPAPRYLLSATVAGTAYYDFPKVGFKLLKSVVSSNSKYENRIDKTYPEHPAQLRLEPNNEFDYKAIEVYCQGYKMGYIPRRNNKVLYNLLKDGAQLKAMVRLQLAPNWQHDELIEPHNFEYAYDLRIRVYLE